MKKIIPAYRSKINYETAENIYFTTTKKHRDIGSKLLAEYNPTDDSLLFQIISLKKSKRLKVLSRYNTAVIKEGKFLKDGKTPARRNKVTYAFQDMDTNEVYANIVLDQSPFKSLEKLYATITDFNFLKNAKNYSLLIEGKELDTFSGKVKHDEEEGTVSINGVDMDKNSIQSSIFNKIINIKKVLIPIMYGFEITELEEMFCLIKKHIMTEYGPTGEVATSFDLHHMKVVNGGSDNKNRDENGDKIEPSNYLLEGTLYSSVEKIKDLMGTISISQTAHKFRHKLWKSEQGIEIYSKDQLPYCLQSEENYNEIINYFGIENDEGYSSFIIKQTNPNTPVEFYHKDRLEMV